MVTEMFIDVDHQVTERKCGEVKWFDTKKGYDFIESEDQTQIKSEDFCSLEQNKKVE